METCTLCRKAFAAILEGVPAKNSGRPVVEHCHECGEMRGVVCGTCNYEMGKMAKSLTPRARQAVQGIGQDDYDQWIRRAVVWLQQHTCWWHKLTVVERYNDSKATVTRQRRGRGKRRRNRA